MTKIYNGIIDLLTWADWVLRKCERKFDALKCAFGVASMLEASTLKVELLKDKC